MVAQDKSTVSLSDGPRPAWMTKGAPPVVGLRVLGADLVFDLGHLERASIGTEPQRDLVLDDPCVSKFHCLLERVGDTLIVQDWRSRNGTYVNSLRCQRVELRDGAILSLGRTHLIAFSEQSRERRTARERLAGQHPAFLRAVDMAEQAAFEGRNVVITGEPGTGKTTLARVIHEMARGPGLPLVEVACAAEPAAVERQLFGDAGSRGAFDAAAGGTLVLDGTAELSDDTLRRVARTLRERGAAEAVASVRVIVTTEQPASALETYFAIDPVIVELPPLRQRAGDLRELIPVFLREHLGASRPGLRPETLRALQRHTWPGNVAELREALRRIVALSTHRSVLAAAGALGMSRSTMRHWIERLGLPRTRPATHVW